MPFYDAGDAAIFYEIEGSGPPLVLLHGYALNGLMWALQRPYFSRTRTVITVDLRGFGKSSCAKEWSGSIMANDVKRLIQSLELKDASIVGFSMSGPVAFRVALESPVEVSKLILVSSILPSRGRPKAKKESELQRKELELLRLRGPEAWADAMGLWSGPLVEVIFKRNPDARSIWEKMIARHNPDYLLCMMSARQQTQSNIDWRSRLSEITIPTLVIAGELDSRFIDSARYLHRNIHGSTLEMIRGAGHMVNLEKPEEFNTIAGKFLSSGRTKSLP